MAQTRLLPVVLLSSLVASASGFSSGSLLDEYRARDFGRFESDLKNGRDFKPILDEATAASSSWPPDVGSAYLLEVSAAAYRAEWFPRLPGPYHPLVAAPSYSGGPFGTSRRKDCMGLFKLATALAERTPPDSLVGRAWARAAVSLLEGAGAGGDPPPRDVPPGDFGTGAGPRALSALLQSMRDRLGEPAVLMAQASIDEAAVASVLSYALAPAVENVLASGDGAAIGSGLHVRGGMSEGPDRELEHGLKTFAEAQAFPGVRAEAAVRWGALALARNKPGDVAAALEHFTIARESNPDQDVLYVSWLLEGQTRRLLGENDVATAAFKKAAQLAPDGSAATLGLAVQVFLAGDPATADQLAQQVLTAPVGADDPWILFRLGDYRHWARRIEDLRGALR